MRLALLGFTPVLFACAALSAQQPTPAALPAYSALPVSSSPVSASNAALPPISVPSGPDHSPNIDDEHARGQAKAAERAQKDKAKSEAKAQKDAEKQKKEAEEDAHSLKLQDNEIFATTFDENGNAVNLPPCSKQDKLCQQKRKEFLKQKSIGLNVQNGTLMIDGFIGKTRLNYDVKTFGYLYIAVPDYGTLLISPERFPNSTEAKDALDHKTLAITTADSHLIQLTSEAVISGRQKRSLFYSVDRTYRLPGNRPSVGYGFASKAPYTWPGVTPLTDEPRRHVAKATEFPRQLEARELAQPCRSSAAASARPNEASGTVVTPPPCKPGEIAGVPGTSGSTTTSRDGSGAVGTVLAENRTR